MNIISCIAGIFAVAGLGVIAAEAINSTSWLAFRLPVTYSIIPLVAIYLIYETAIHKIRHKTDHGEPAGKAAGLLLGTTRSIYVILGIMALLSIPLLWWGVIKRLAALVGEGNTF